MANDLRRVVGQVPLIGFRVSDAFATGDPVEEMRMVPVAFAPDKSLTTHELRVYLAWDFDGDGAEIGWTLRGRNDGVTDPAADGWTDQIPTAIYGSGEPETGTQDAPESALVLQDAVTARGVIVLIYSNPPHVWEITGVQTDVLDEDVGIVERSYSLIDTALLTR